MSLRLDKSTGRLLVLAKTSSDSLYDHLSPQALLGDALGVHQPVYAARKPRPTPAVSQNTVPDLLRSTQSWTTNLRTAISKFNIDQQETSVVFNDSRLRRRRVAWPRHTGPQLFDKSGHTLNWP